MKYCPFCGAGLDEGFAFCPKCGKPFEREKENPNLAGKSVLQETPAAAAAAPVLPSTVEASPKKKKRGGLIAAISVVVVLAIVGGLFVSGAFAPKSFTDNTEAIARASNSVVMLTCYDRDGKPYATGSGFAAFEDGVIVTNYHVIEQDTYRVSAKTERGFSFECPTVLAYDAEKDIAILKADRKTDIALLPVGTADNLQKGAKVVAIGSPLGLINSVSTGVFSGYIEDNTGLMLQFTAPISHGSSGGALFNDAGEVIGITFASLADGQSLNLGIPIDNVKALYESSGAAKAMSMEAFYDSFEHIPTYTVEYVLGHFNELNGQTMYVEGYVSSVFWQIKTYLVSTPSEVLNYDTVDIKTNTDTIDALLSGQSIYDEAHRQENIEKDRVKQYKCICISINSTALSETIKPSKKVSVLCELEIRKSASGTASTQGDALHFTALEMSILD